MGVTIDGTALNEEIFVPAGERVFWIGYDLPALAGVDIHITDLRVDGLPR